jgi:hypothetical protein
MKYILEFQKFNESLNTEPIHIDWHISRRENMAITRQKPSDISYHLTPMLQNNGYEIISITDSQLLNAYIFDENTCVVIFYDDLDRTPQDIKRIKELVNAGYFLILLTTKNVKIDKSISKYFEHGNYDEHLSKTIQK